MPRLHQIFFGLFAVLSSLVFALPTIDEMSKRQTASTITFEFEDVANEILSISVPTDGQKHVVSTLPCNNEATGAAAAGCATAQVKLLVPNWTGYCCEIDWNKCLNQGTILGGGFTIGKSIKKTEEQHSNQLRSSSVDGLDSMSSKGQW